MLFIQYTVAPDVAKAKHSQRKKGFWIATQSLFYSPCTKILTSFYLVTQFYQLVTRVSPYVACYYFHCGSPVVCLFSLSGTGGICWRLGLGTSCREARNLYNLLLACITLHTIVCVSAAPTTGNVSSLFPYCSFGLAFFVRPEERFCFIFLVHPLSLCPYFFPLLYHSKEKQKWLK